MIQPSGFQGLAGFFAAVRVGRWGGLGEVCRRLGEKAAEREARCAGLFGGVETPPFRSDGDGTDRGDPYNGRRASDAVRVGRWGEASQRRMGGGGFADVSETPLKMTIRKHGWPAFSGI
jgi:hypothetical protein